MSIKKLDDGRYEVDVRPTGRNGKRIRRKFAKKHEATAFERYVLANQHDKAWIDKPKDARPLSELIQLWWIYHGQNTKWGAHTRRTLELVGSLMNHPCVFQIDSNAIACFRSRLLTQGLKASSVNRRLIALGGMFSFLIDAGMYHAPHPLKGTKKLKEPPTAMSYLSKHEIKALLTSLDGDNRDVALLCLSTGARWSEAAELRAEHVINQRVMFVATKNGKTRVVPISADVSARMVDGKSGRLFPNVDYLTVRKVLREVKPDLPHGQASHVLRHTFATHFMAHGGNIITLQRVLGHATIQQTMSYAHFAPDYLQDTITFNPLRGGVEIE
ncbi:TPA: tyrosine-type recombinase/integrase [Aeromonas hydrophila]|uniref:phage integrase n=1 Tax=Aeromonas hydrophila TaxID=644 RepID=UPI00107EAF4E|nr:tyrosine-type recombinase/integrase [Aeromonas hydrophila]MCV3294452.1 tyrosine-type recombinase/integrase [Aeromonas hydrophila]QBX71014.1 integrase [Aeromonas hydrophila]QBX75740.1 integrase [Aeromonas hydrophila]WDA26152.1 tyrosine-type recombinase/integrase [Aeromonas hydrophila]WES92031.1 tyrosine-type recombinase/integrase [Aeromonas hydrophila]